MNTMSTTKGELKRAIKVISRGSYIIEVDNMSHTQALKWMRTTYGKEKAQKIEKINTNGSCNN